MKKVNRVLKYPEFQEILHGNNFKNSEDFAVYYRKNDFNFERYGILVTKKNGIAVIRNKIKRQVRMMIDQVSDYSLSLDVIVVVKKKYNTLNFKQNETELTSLLSTIRSINEQ